LRLAHLAGVLAALLAFASPAAAQKRIALSFDDVPRNPGAFYTPAERTVALIAALSRGGVHQAAFFITPGNLGAAWGPGGEDRIQAYVAAGHVIANHSWSHRHLSEMTPQDYVADVDRAAVWLAGRPGYRPWFRFPFLDEGADATQHEAARSALAARRLANGYVTADPSDWHLDQLVIDAARAGAAIDREALRDLYVADIVAAADHADRLARETLGRQPVQVLLLHETDLAAAYIESAVAALRAGGWAIVPIDAAFAHPLPEPHGSWIGGNRIEALAAAAGRPPQPSPDEIFRTDTLTRLFHERVLHQTVPAG
jgi:peptidoglycan-N-acetylglucosamine deacetylase